MYRCIVIKSLFRSPGTASALHMPSAAGSSFALTKFTGKMVTGSTSSKDSTAGLLKNRRPYSSTVSQPPASSARTSYTLLPEELTLPGPVKYIEFSTPMITKGELEEYFYPLFRRGWELKRLEANDGFSDPNHASPFLVRNFHFKGNKSARAFLQEIFRIESEEKHHISFNLWSGKRPVVTVMTQTHSCRKFGQSPETHYVTTDTIKPGPTLRDIRIAVLLENLLGDPDRLTARAPGTDRVFVWPNLFSQYCKELYGGNR